MLGFLEPFPLTYAASYSKCKGPLNIQLWPFLFFPPKLTFTSWSLPCFQGPNSECHFLNYISPQKPFLLINSLLHSPKQAVWKQWSKFPALWLIRCPRLKFIICPMNWIKVWRVSYLCPQYTRPHSASTRGTVWSVAWGFSTKIKSTMYTYISTLCPCMDNTSSVRSPKLIQYLKG